MFCLAGILGTASSVWAVPTIAVDEASVEGAYTITCQDLGCPNTGTFPFTEGLEVQVVIPIVPALGAPLSGSVNFREANGPLSDVVFLSGTAGGSVEFDFVSTNETGFPVLDPIPGLFLFETGHPQEVATGTLADGLELHVTFASDVDAVPEPSAWLLLGSGLVGLILWRKRTA
jgi:PEP-CTERM motif